MKIIDKILDIGLYEKHYLVAFETREGVIGHVTKPIRNIFKNSLHYEIESIRKFVANKENIKGRC